MDNTKENQTDLYSILPFDPIVIVRDVLKNWLIVALAAVFAGVVTYIAVDLSYKPVYQTTTTFVVTAQNDAATVYSDLNSTNNLAAVFTDLLNSSIMRKTILQEMGIASFDGTITTAVVPETNLIAMKVTASDPRTAFLVNRAIIDHHEDLTYQILNGIIVEVLLPPVMPMSPVNGSSAMRLMKRMMVLTALVVIVLLGMLSWQRDAVRSEKEAQTKLDCRFLGQIPHERQYKTILARLGRRKTGILVSNPLTSFHFVESLRKLSSRLEKRMRTGKVLMVTSLLENEGKSTMAVNLALTMEQRGKRVLLVDCDLRKPACRTLLERKHVSYGLRDVLTDRVALSEALLRHERRNLYMILEKKADSRSAQLLSSTRMRQLLDWAEENFDYVILDMPPILAASDAESMKDLTDAAVLVVRQNAALAKDLNRAVAALDGGKAKLLGCVLNDVRATRLTPGDGYGYGYGGYRYYGHYGKKS